MRTVPVFVIFKHIEVMHFLAKCTLNIRVLLQESGEAGCAAFLRTDDQEVRKRS